MTRRHAVQMMALILLGVCLTSGPKAVQATDVPAFPLISERPRLLAAVSYLRDAYIDQLSERGRLRCAVDCIYLCCCELAQSSGLLSSELEHPNLRLVRAGASAVNLSRQDALKVERLIRWGVEMSPFLPTISVDDARILAQYITIRTISALRTTGESTCVSKSPPTRI